MSIVYVVQESFGKNISPARDYGNIQLLLDRNDTLGDPDFFIGKLQHKLSNFKKDDFLLLIGDPIAIGIATAIALDKTHGTLSVLRWDREHYKYVRKEILL